ncbi:MAG: restriction endonuclease subunit S [Rhodocyclaceae bacterium]|nr:restriction endonuclease subunit S [Rhodocyclaceae bacterium]MCA3081531.1 restriction endonuclease subunit S [Rhodocyclaceae bacterium]
MSATLPNGWTEVALTNLATVEMGQSPDSRSYNNEGKGLPFFQGKAEFQTTFPEIRKWCSAPTKVVERGDILLSIRAPVGPTNIAPEISCIGRGLAGIRAEAGVNQAYLYYFFKQIEPWLSDQGTGSTFAAVSGQFVREISCPLAPSGEQTRIVEKLEEVLSEHDVGVAELKAAQKKLAQYRQSLLKAAVEGTLTTAWRAQNSPTETGAQLLERILVERRARWEAKQLAKFKDQGKAPPKDWQKKYPEPEQPDTTDLPQVPVGWVWASVDQLSESVRNGVSRTPNTSGRGFPIFKINAVRPMVVNFAAIKHIEIAESDAAEYLVEVGDVLATRYNGSVDLLGVFAMVKSVPQPTLHPDKLIRMKPLLGAQLGAWMEVCGNVGASRRHLVSRVKTTAGQTGISGEDLKKTPIPLPPVLEQEAALGHLEALSQSVNELETWTSLSLKQAVSQRRNILRAAFAGDLVAQDPNDEPASVLLERIRAARAERDKQPKARKTKQQKETAAMLRKLTDVLAEAGDWVAAQEAFQRCGIGKGTDTDQVEALYAELRALDKAGRLAVETVTDKQGRKLHDRLKLLAA